MAEQTFSGSEKPKENIQKWEPIPKSNGWKMNLLCHMLHGCLTRTNLQCRDIL